MRSVHAYTLTAKVLKDQVEEILNSDTLTQGERLVAVEVLNNVAGNLSEIFLKDNPRGFDVEMFFTDAGLGERDWQNLISRTRRTFGKGATRS